MSTAWIQKTNCTRKHLRTRCAARQGTPSADERAPLLCRGLQSCGMPLQYAQSILFDLSGPFCVFAARRRYFLGIAKVDLSNPHGFSGDMYVKSADHNPRRPRAAALSPRRALFLP